MEGRLLEDEKASRPRWKQVADAESTRLHMRQPCMERIFEGCVATNTSKSVALTFANRCGMCHKPRACYPNAKGILHQS